MATSIISNTVTNPSGTALEGVPVVVRLVPGGGFRISDSSEVTPKVTTVTDSSGDWSLVLEENANITPANSYYEVEEQLTAAQGGPRKFTFEVGANDATLLASLVSPINDITSSNYLTQAAADLRYVQSPGSFGAAGVIQPITPDDNADGGVETTYARSDHQHATDPMPWGFIGYAEVSSNAAPFSAITDLPGAAVTFTAVAGRRYRITGSVLFIVSSASTQIGLGIWSATEHCTVVGPGTLTPVGGIDSLFVSVIVAPGAGSITYKLRASRQAGTGLLTTSIAATRPDYILIEDIGPT